jgi:hypothetical protein
VRVQVVEYLHRIPYPRDSKGNPFPILQLRIFHLADSEQAIDLDAYLDSGAEYSLFNGWIVTALGLDLYSGAERQYGPIIGPTITGKIHRISLSHPVFGSFELDMGFSTQEIHREILGRDFFNLAQVGFRERQLEFYLTPAP